jgi:protein phosphatase
VSKLLVGSATDVGLVRSNNQDQFLVSPGLYAVADGMGGHAAGEVASSTAIKALQAAFAASGEHSAEALESAAKAANRAVWEQARTNRGMLGMGTTLVALAVVEHGDGTNALAVAHIGDSRLYLLQEGALRQLTVDHSLVQELVDDGQISPAQAAVHPQRHVLTRALGVEPTVEVDIIDVTPRHGDRYLLCSDGLPREASDEQIAAVLARFSDPSEAAKELVTLANERGGSDNITAVVVDVLANEDSPETLIVVPAPATSSNTARRRPPTESAGQDGKGPPPPAPERAEPPLGPAKPIGAVPRRVTGRVIAFVVALCIVIGGAIASLGWYARSAYFVTISKGRITILQGRPGGVLWFQPTVVERTAYGPSSVLAYNLEPLATGVVEPSLTEARSYISQKLAEKRESEPVTPPSARGAPRPKHAKHKAPTTTRPKTTVPKRPSTTVPKKRSTTVSKKRSTTVSKKPSTTVPSKAPTSTAVTVTHEGHKKKAPT